MYQMIEQARSSNSDPMDLLKQITNGYSPEQMSGLLGRAKQMGVPDNILEQIQNGGINAK